MSNCKSTYNVVSKLYKEYGDEATKLGCTVAGAIAENPEVVVKCIETAGKIEEIIDKMTHIWSQLAGSSSWATIGSRMLNEGTRYKGTLVGTSGRFFITQNPCHFNKARFRLWETDGKAKTEVTLCVMDAKGNVRKVGHWLLNEDKSEKKKEHQKIDKKFSGMKGNFVIVHLDAKSVTNKFKYRLELSERS